MRTLVLNGNNIIPDGQNNKLRYRFPNSVQFKDTYVSVQSITMFYSWYNISASKGNNTFSFTFTSPAGGGIQFYTVVIPDGIYDIVTLDEYLQFYCLANGLYMKTSVGQNVFFLSFAINASAYGVQICCYTVPSSADNTKGYIPSSTGFPNASFLPQITIPANFNKIVGYPAGWTSANFIGAPSSSGFYNLVPYTWNATTGVVGYLSSQAPQVNPDASIYLSLTSINNPYSLPSSIIYAITPSTGIGGVIIDKPPQFCWNKFIDGTYNQLDLQILGSDLQPITIYDPTMTILLAIKDSDEWGGK